MGEEIELKGRLDGRQRNRLKSLLNMKYRPREIAEEVGFSVHQVYRVYIPLGCPHLRDERRHIWINGTSFAKWYVDFYKKRRLQDNESFCLTCRIGVEKINPKRHKDNNLIYDISFCPGCGRKLAKIVDRVK
jgi:hypothetical protein